MGNRDLTTEEMGRRAQELYAEKYALLDADIRAVIAEIDGYIVDADNGGSDRLIELFDNPVFKGRYESDKRVAYMYVALDIYKAESGNVKRKNIFNTAGNVENIIYLIREIKYLLWRMEFAGDAQAWEQICYNSNEGDISSECIVQLVLHYSIDKLGMLYELAAGYADSGMRGYAQYILDYLTAAVQDNRDVSSAVERFREQYGL